MLIRYVAWWSGNKRSLSGIDRIEYCRIRHLDRISPLGLLLFQESNLSELVFAFHRSQLVTVITVV